MRRLPRLSWLLKAGLTAALLVLLIRLADPAQILHLAAAASLPMLLLALALMPLNLLLEGSMWHLLVRLEIPDQPFRRSLGAMLCGYAVGFFTPSSVGEFAGRAWYLPHDDKWALSAMVLAERMVAMAVVVIPGTGALALVLAHRPLPYADAWTALLLVGALAGGGLAAVLLMPRPVYRLVGRLPRGHRAQRHLGFLLTIRHGRIAALLGLGLLRYAGYVAQFFVLLRAFLPEAPLWEGLQGVMLVFYTKFLIPSITLLDLGIREGASVFFFGHLGLPDAVGLQASLLVFALHLLIPAALGLPFLLRLRVSRPEGFALPIWLRRRAVSPDDSR